MRISRVYIILLLIFITGGLIFGGGISETDPVGESPQPQAEEPIAQEAQRAITLTDCNGNEVTLTVPVKRAAALNPGSMLSVIKALHAEDRVLGIIKSIKGEPIRYPYFSTLAEIGSPDAPDYEAILSLDPDIVFVPYWTTDEVEEKLSPEIPVFRLNVGPPLTYKDEVTKIGIIFGEEDNAAAYISWYEGLVDSVTSRTKSLTESEKPKVFDFYGGDWGMTAGPPYGTYGKDNFWVAPMIDMAGGFNISGDLPGDWMTVDPEWVITENPEIIIREVFGSISGRDVTGYNAEGSEKMAGMRDVIIRKSSLETTEAVRSDRVYMVEGSLIQSHWFLGLQYMAKWMHPELFEDLDPQAVHQEFLEKFQRIDFDVSEQGVFVYPEE